MQLKQIYKILDELSPFELQESWDNSGLQVGEMDDEVQRVYLSLDVDSSLLDEVEENSLIIVHHPLIFKGLKKIDSSIFPSSLIKKMIKKDISLIAMHTNFDTTHLNKYVATKILGYKNIECDGHICYFNVDCSFDELALHVKESLGLEIVKSVVAKEYIKKCALTTGSGGDLISGVNADCFLSGDFKYHQALEAKENGLSLLDIGHFESESHFPVCLSENLINFPLKVIMSNSKNPFTYK
ncbi:Nif3-like dinuclear metal center hexameric protein [Sulfurospirillum arcachonense]|uniref:Nif3-like dinuclear metal center hexameric protein n=1 Tax=Sulfurospirillum arcachonense TaxID=57666 RepID=UPI00046A5B80|nr:Nif3-like dinuclear metal center hexameric protein [Sulfurospirillum arcachonense]